MELKSIIKLLHSSMYPVRKLIKMSIKKNKSNTITTVSITLFTSKLIKMGYKMTLENVKISMNILHFLMKKSSG